MEEDAEFSEDETIANNRDEENTSNSSNLDHWNQMQDARYSEGTIKKYLGVIKRLIKWLMVNHREYLKTDKEEVEINL